MFKKARFSGPFLFLSQWGMASSCSSLDLDARFGEVLAQRGAARKRFSIELWADVINAGSHPLLDRLVALHKSYPDMWAPSSKERLTWALSAPATSAIQWCLSRQEFGWGAAPAQPLTDVERVELGNAVSHSLTWSTPGETATLPAVLAVFGAHPDVMRAITLQSTARLSTLLDEALDNPDDLATLLRGLAKASPGAAQPGNAVAAWLGRHAQKDTAAQARRLAEMVHRNPGLAQALSAYFPLSLPGFSLSVPRSRHLDIHQVTPMEINSLEQLYGWTGGRGMEWAFSSKPVRHSAHAVCQDPEMFGSWLARAANSPAIVSRLLSRDKDLSRAMRAWRSEQGGTALDVLIAPRLFMTINRVVGVHLPWTRLEAWFDRNAPELFSICRANGLSFDDLIEEHFPRWAASRRRSALAKLTSTVPKQPVNPRPPRL